MGKRKNEPECLVCKHCVFSEGNGSPSRWYCNHPENPNRVDGYSSATLINKGQRHDSFNNIPRQYVPRWCPYRKNNWEGF